jgi:hypothetical protein
VRKLNVLATEIAGELGGSDAQRVDQRFAKSFPVSRRNIDPIGIGFTPQLCNSERSEIRDRPKLLAGVGSGNPAR